MRCDVAETKKQRLISEGVRLFPPMSEARIMQLKDPKWLLVDKGGSYESNEEASRPFLNVRNSGLRAANRIRADETPSPSPAHLLAKTQR